MKKAFLVFLGFIFLIVLIYAFHFLNAFSIFKRVNNIPQISKNDSKQSESKNTDIPQISTVAKNLEVPWALVFLPDGSMLVTERPGRLRLIDADGNLLQTPVATISKVKQIGEGGLLGITASPQFSTNHFIYLYYTYSGDGQNTLNRVSRFTYQNQQLTDEKIIVDNIPGAVFHNGGRIKFGPDNFLYITAGDSLNPSLAQDTNSLAGKILRVTEDGKSAPGNPFGNLVYSFGHRNPQGLTWDSDGKLWETEHGQTATDEINLIEPGKNYGWPTIRGDEKKEGLVSPVLHSGQDTWAPSGLVHLNGSLYFGGLRGQALFEAKIENSKLTLKTHLKGQLGRIREVLIGPDNMLYITTSNRDGRGVPLAGDDKIIRINPEKL